MSDVPETPPPNTTPVLRAERHSRLPASLAVLRHRNFALYWTAQLVSFTGTWMQILATVWVLYRVTRSPFLIGLNGAFQSIPILGLSYVGGAVADRVNRRLILVVTEFLFMVLTALLSFLALFGRITLWEIYTISGVTSIVSAFNGPAGAAILPAPVPSDELGAAAVSASVLWRTGRLIGPALAGLVIASVGPGGAFLVNSGTSLVVLPALLLMRGLPRLTRIEPVAVVGHVSIRTEIIEGLCYLRDHGVVRSILLLEGVSNVLGDNATMLTLFAGEIFHIGPAGLGLLTSALGVDAVKGSIVMVAVPRIRFYGHVMVVSAIAYALSLIAFGLTAHRPPSLVLLFALGATDAVWSAARSASLQLATPETVRGRVMGLFTLTTQGLGPLGQIETGTLASLLSVPAQPVVSGVAILAVDLWVTFGVPKFWRFRTGPAAPGDHPPD